MNLKEKISTARDRIKELELMVSVWESQLPKKKFGEKNDHVEPTVKTPNGPISETLKSGTLGEYYSKPLKENK